MEPDLVHKSKLLVLLVLEQLNHIVHGLLGPESGRSTFPLNLLKDVFDVDLAVRGSLPCRTVLDQRLDNAQPQAFDGIIGSCS